MFLSIGMLKQKYFLTDIFILSAEKQPIKLSWRKIEWLHIFYVSHGGTVRFSYRKRMFSLWETYVFLRGNLIGTRLFFRKVSNVSKLLVFLLFLI